MHTGQFSLCLVWLTRKGASTSKELQVWPDGKLGGFWSFPLCLLPSKCCSLVLILALPQCISYKTLLYDISCVFEPQKLLKAGPDTERTHSSPYLAFTYVNTDYLQDMGWKRHLSNYNTSQARLRVLVYTRNQVFLWNHIYAVLLPIVSQVFKQSQLPWKHGSKKALWVSV